MCERMVDYRKLDHPNVVKLLNSEEYGLVFEFCEATLLDVVNGTYKGKIPPERDVLIQLARGILHMHEKSVVYGKIRPTRVMIRDGVVKWADFSSDLPVGRLTMKSDVFLLGCLFFWYIFRTHPFGLLESEIENNIRKRCAENFYRADGHPLRDLLHSMLSVDPPDMSHVLECLENTRW